MQHKKKYTIYEIEKITHGQLSKYKIKQAIKSGNLIAQYLDPEKAGRGAPKYLITEESLTKYLQSLKNIKNKEATYKDTTIQISKKKELPIEIEATMQIQKQKQELAELKNRVQFLENQNAKIEPLLRQQLKNAESELNKEKEGRGILLELANMNIWSIFTKQKKQELLKRLNQIL